MIKNKILIVTKVFQLTIDKHDINPLHFLKNYFNESFKKKLNLIKFFYESRKKSVSLILNYLKLFLGFLIFFKAYDYRANFLKK